MIPYSIRILRAQPLRLCLTCTGIALCIVLMLFLISIYQGVADGSVEYIRHNNVDLWVLQENATNILRGSSILSSVHGALLKRISLIDTAAPILFILSAIRKEKQIGTVYLTGYDPSIGLGEPPRIAEGRLITSDDEIVLDRAFALKMGFRVGDYVRLKDDSLRVVGLSEGTNMFVIQYAFVTLRRAQLQIGYPGLVTTYLIRLKDGSDLPKAKEQIRDELMGVEVYDQHEFLQNNIREMESGILPLLYTIAILGTIVLTAILSLLLSINILERRKDFAVMKTLGAPSGFLPRVIVQQALFLAFFSSIFAFVGFFPIVATVELFSPEVSTRITAAQMIAMGCAVVFICILGSLISVQRLRKIYPLEAFS